MTTTNQLTAIANYIEELERVRNHASFLADAIIAGNVSADDLRECANDINDRLGRADTAKELMAA